MTPSSIAAELEAAYRGRRVLVTGHTGFKGSWLATWLHHLGAEVTGYALAPQTRPALFHAAGVEARVSHVVADVRDRARIANVVGELAPEVVFHLAAQALVRRSYERPFETLETNVLGTAAALEAVRRAGRPCAVVVVTSDKCYEPSGECAHVEDDPMGGRDPYSMSKGAAELVVAGWRRSFFPPERLAEHGVAVATARAGNVLGGGDWAPDRIVPDAIAALASGRPIRVRNPDAVRPWQHVLEPLGGYLLLGARLLGVATQTPAAFCEGWNFGPRPTDAQPVRRIVEGLVDAWGGGTWECRPDPIAPEASFLSLDSEKARQRLGWAPRWTLSETLARTVAWYRAFHGGASPRALSALCEAQIREWVGS